LPTVAAGGKLGLTDKDAAVFTVIELKPVSDEFEVSVAVSACVPAVSIVAEKLAFPAASVELAGSLALPSLLENWTVPE